jgi:hypothetical protein
VLKDKARDDSDYSWYGASIDENAIRQMTAARRRRGEGRTRGREQGWTWMPPDG